MSALKNVLFVQFFLSIGNRQQISVKKGGKISDVGYKNQTLILLKVMILRHLIDTIFSFPSLFPYKITHKNLSLFLRK